MTPTQVCCRHFFSVLGASATCWHPGRHSTRAPSVPHSPTRLHPPPSRQHLGSPLGQSGLSDQVSVPCFPSSKPPALTLQLHPFLLTGMRVRPSGQAPSLGRGLALPYSPSPRAPGREQKISTKGTTWVSGCGPSMPTPSCSCRARAPASPSPSAQPSNPSLRRGLQAQAEAKGLHLPPHPTSGSLQIPRTESSNLLPPGGQGRPESRSPTMAQQGWPLLLPSPVRGCKQHPQGHLWSRGQEEPGTGPRVTLGSPGSGCPRWVWKEGGPCPV